MQSKGRMKKLDDFRWIAAFLVVAIHTSPLESINETADFLLTRVLARVAVPFFFMVTGFFVLSGTKEGGRKILHTVKKTGLWYLVLTLVYLPVQIYKLAGEPINVSVIGKLLKAIFFDGTYYHLWYLPALMLGLVLSWFLLKLGRKRAMVCASALYVLGLLGDSYYGITERILPLSKLYDGMFVLFSHTRNGLFYAPLFLILGYEMAELYREKGGFSGNHLRNGIICMCFMVAEALILHKNGFQRHDSMYLILPFVMMYLFGYLLSGSSKECRNIFYLKGPMLVYFLHPLVILVLRGFVKVTGLQIFLKVSPLYYLAVLAGSLCAAWVCLWVQKLWRERKRRQNHVSER